MAGMTLTVAERVALAERLGIDPRTMTHEKLVERVEQMQARSFADADPTGIIRITDTRPGSAPRVTGGRDDAADVALDAAIGRGAVGTEERDSWATPVGRRRPDLAAARPSARADAALISEAGCSSRRSPSASRSRQRGSSA